MTTDHPAVPAEPGGTPCPVCQAAGPRPRQLLPRINWRALHLAAGISPRHPGPDTGERP